MVGPGCVEAGGGQMTKQVPLAGDFGVEMITPKPEVQKLMEEVQGDTLRPDGRIERTCKHGVGHTVGHVKPEELLKKYAFSHGCDGCCHNYKTRLDLEPSLKDWE
jgi:hypothetical protein